MDELPKPEEIRQLVSLLAPGLIILWIRSRAAGGPVPPWQERLLHYAFISAVYYAAAPPLFCWRGGVVLPPSLVDFLLYFGLPVVVGCVLAWAHQHVRIRYLLGVSLSRYMPAAWDYQFGRFNGGYVMVTLDSGENIAGKFAAASFASSSKEERDLLLERVYEIDPNGVWTEILPPRSLLLCGRNIRHIEFVEP